MGNFDRAIFTTSILNTIGSLLPRGWAWRRSALGPLQTLLTVMNMVAFTERPFGCPIKIG